MRQINWIIRFLLPALVAFSCIKPFDPQIGPGDQALYVVSGQVTDQEGFQYASVSVSAETSDPRYISLSGCQAEIQDDRGNVYPMEDAGGGNYRVWIGQAGLSPGIAYRIRVITPSGTEIISGFDRMPECPEIDSVYFQVESILTNDPAQPIHGIRFYADLDATAYESYFFRWELEETWEYHMDYAREWYYDGAIHKIDPPDRSTQICWYTAAVKEIFTVSTANLAQNIYLGYPLHFTDNKTHKLTVLYSLLVRQYALSETAYIFWDKLRVNSQGQGGLYETQPLSIDGNLHVPADQEARVLGYFGAAAVRTKRVFVSDVEGLGLDPQPLCIGPVPLGIFGWSEFPPEDYPIYFTRIGGAVFTLDDQCIDCRLSGGVNVKPGFWPEK